MAWLLVKQGKKVVVVDDVISTGSTLQGMRLILGKAGAEVAAARAEAPPWRRQALLLLAAVAWLLARLRWEDSPEAAMPMGTR